MSEEGRSNLEGSTHVRQWLAIAVMCAAIVPLAILLHELGHAFGYWAFHFKSPTLHYASSSFAGEREFWTQLREGDAGAASRIAGVTQAGLSASFGVVISYLLVTVGLWGLGRFKAVAFLGLAMSSAARFPLVFILVVLGRSEHTDEAHVALALGVPEVLLTVLGIFALISATVGGGVLLARQGRRWLIVPTAIGVIAGTTLWMGVIGPHVLP